MFSDVHIITNRGRDYESIPRESTGSYHAFKNSKAIGSPVRFKSYFEIVNGPHGVYVVVTNLSNRTDTVNRRINTCAIFRAKDLRTALHVFDARKHLLQWSEDRWQDKSGGSDDALLKILETTKPKTTEKDLAQWQAFHITETQAPPRPKGLATLFNWFAGRSSAPVEKQVGTLHYYEEQPLQRG